MIIGCMLEALAIKVLHILCVTLNGEVIGYVFICRCAHNMVRNLLGTVPKDLRPRAKYTTIPKSPRTRPTYTGSFASSAMSMLAISAMLRPAPGPAVALITSEDSKDDLLLASSFLARDGRSCLKGPRSQQKPKLAL